jgi:hypothetical protein
MFGMFLRFVKEVLVSMVSLERLRVSLSLFESIDIIRIDSSPCLLRS